MKKISILFILAITSFSSYAQSSFKEDVEVLQSIYGKSKSDLVKEYMSLPETQSTAFMKVYDNYETERKALGQTKFQLINDYAANYATLTDEKADELAKATLKKQSCLRKIVCQNLWSG